MDPESSYLSWTVELATEQPLEAIKEVFEFVEDECTLEICKRSTSGRGSVEPDRRPSNSPTIWQLDFELTEKSKADTASLQNLLTELARIGSVEVQKQPLPDEKGQLAGTWSLTIETPSANEQEIADCFLFFPAKPIIAKTAKAAPRPAKTATPKNTISSESLRVEASKIDRLVDMVGELVILKSQLRDACSKIPDLPSELDSASEGFERLTIALRDLALDVRTTPIGETFNRFHRLCRDSSRDLGKSLSLEIEGGDTSVDKSVIECLKDPLVHLLRNSIDHGIESPEERRAAGKPDRATIKLTASQSGNSVQITISDDGRGLDIEKIRAKAIKRGLIKPGSVLSEEELTQLIFQPGFSTAEKVSQLSGRGVGLDAVKRELEKLRGSIELKSVAGQGTTFTLCLPLTLAIIEGLLVGIDGDHYVIPLNNVHETIELEKAQREAANGRNIIDLRGSVLPYVTLRPLFGYDSKRPDREKVVIVEFEEKLVGLVVDDVIGNHQTVLKSLGWAGQRNDVFSGSTVLGNGRIGLICDIGKILAMC